MGISFIHTADVHIGMKFTKDIIDNTTSKNKRIDIMNTFLKIIERCKMKNIDFLFISGDLFEDDLCRIADLKIINDKFKKLKNTNVIMISGNHDYLNNKSLYNLIDWNENVYIIKDKDLDRLVFDKYKLEIWGLSWHTKEREKEEFENIKLNKYKNNILLLHADLLNNKSKYMPVNKDELINLGFDYVALGHIHKKQCITDNICYPGSPEPLDFSELGEHGIIEGNIDKNGLKLEFVPIAKRQYYNFDIDINENMTYDDILNKILDLDNTEKKKRGFFRVILNGFIDQDIKYNIDELEYNLKDEFYFIKIVDKTKENYDINTISKNNQNNIIGIFIEEMKNKGLDDEIIKKAMDIGIEELLEEKGI